MYLDKTNESQIASTSPIRSFLFQCNEKEAEILALIAEIEILKAQNNELISHRDDGASKARKQVSLVFSL